MSLSFLGDAFLHMHTNSVDVNDVEIRTVGRPMENTDAALFKKFLNKMASWTGQLFCLKTQFRPKI